MEKIHTPTVGSQFTTQKSAVTGIVTEVKENTNGTLRIKLDVNGQDRWTTVKQFNQTLVGSLPIMLGSLEVAVSSQAPTKTV